MPKVTEAHRVAKRDHIVDAALRSFMRKGFTRTSMADIITESQLSAGAIYSYFTGKDEIFTAVAERVMGRRIGEVSELNRLGEITGPSDIIASFLRGMLREGFAPVVVQLWGEATVDDNLRAIVNTVIHRLRSTVTAALLQWAEQNPDAVAGDVQQWASRIATVLTGFGPGFLLQAVLIDDFDIDGALAALREVVAGYQFPDGAGVPWNNATE